MTLVIFFVGMVVGALLMGSFFIMPMGERTTKANERIKTLEKENKALKDRVNKLKEALIRT